MTILTPEEVLPQPNCTIVRHDSYGSTQTNRLEISRSIKANFNNDVLVRAFTIAVHASPAGSPQEQVLAFLVEYDNGHIELFDQHDMSINRSPREGEIIFIVRTLISLGFGDRIFFCTKRLPTEVFQQTPLLTTTVIKSKNIKTLIPHWHQFTSVNNEGHRTLHQSAFKEKEWNKMPEMIKTSINQSTSLEFNSFLRELRSHDKVLVGHIANEEKDLFLVIIRGRKAFTTICKKDSLDELDSILFHSNDDGNVNYAANYDVKSYGDFINANIITDKAFQLIMLNNTSQITDMDDHHYRWIFRK